MNTRISTGTIFFNLTEVLDTICGLSWNLNEHGCVEAFTWSLRLHYNGQMVSSRPEMSVGATPTYLLKDT